MPRYRYTRLVGQRDIRLLILHPGAVDNELAGSLKLRGPNEEYEALSWTWGTEEDRFAVRILDDTTGVDEGLLSIKPNLESALKQLRLQSNKRKLWIDAVCIDQENKDEKNEQVRLMADIYSKAKRVCVWLGKERDDSGRAVKFIREEVLRLGGLDKLVENGGKTPEWAALVALMTRDWFSRRWVVQEIALAKDAVLYVGKDMVQWSQFAVVVTLFERRVKRIAQKTEELREFGNDPDYFGAINAMGASRLVNTASSLYREGDDGQIIERLISLEALVSILADFEARVPHDVFYAVLALGKDTWHRSSIGPRSTVESGPTEPAIAATNDTAGGRSTFDHPATIEYNGGPGRVDEEPDNDEEDDWHTAVESPVVSVSKRDEARMRNVVSTLKRSREQGRDSKDRKFFNINYKSSFFEVCQDFMTFAISRSESLDILCRPWAPEDVGEDLPSWIPTLAGAPFARQPDDRAAGGWKMKRQNADPLVGQSILERKIYTASKHATAAQCWRFGDKGTEHKFSMFLRGFELDTISGYEGSDSFGNIPGKWLKLGGWRDRNHPTPEAFWRTLVADRAPNGLNVPLYYTLAWQYAIDQSNPRTGIDVNNLINNGGCEIMTEFLRRVQSVICNRTFIRTTREDFPGLGPEDARTGDSVCIIHGCSVPVILRKITHTSDKCEKHYYRFLGAAYVHGMMDGEAISLQEYKELPSMVFELR